VSLSTIAILNIHTNCKLVKPMIRKWSLLLATAAAISIPATAFGASGGPLRLPSNPSDGMILGPSACSTVPVSGLLQPTVTPPTLCPEPGTIALAVAGALGIAGMRRSRRLH
jgi:hypothetical protein